MKLYLAFFFVALFNLAKSQDFFGVYQGKKIPYYLSTKKIILSFDKNPVSGFDSLILIGNVENEAVLKEGGVSMVSLHKKNGTKNEVKVRINQLKKFSQISYSAPVIERENGEIVAGLTNRLVVGLKKRSDLILLKEYSKKWNLIALKQYEFDDRVYYLTLSKNSNHYSIEIALEISETGLFRYAEPEYLLLNSFGTDDPSFGQQWAINSMNVQNAWNLTTGCSSIRVAILDNGVELTHPDLVGNLLPGFDATGTGTNGGSTGSTSIDSHGTKCAGIVAATANNGIGLAGVAYNCRIVPVRVGSGSFSSFTNIAAGIDWIRSTNSADIISFSSGSMGGTSQQVTDAINLATSNGRNGLGIPFFSITQNDGTNSIAYPASLDNVIAVGSINSSGNRAPSSNFGTGIDIVAPGVCIFTTDFKGAIGSTNSDYESCFSGTSAACPNAAGVMALILSINPSLTLAQARFILESTTDKLSGFTFSSGVSGQPNGTWNSEVGYGKVNANRAVSLAASINITSNPICSSSTFTLQYPQAVTWTSSNPSGLQLTSGQGTGSATFNRLSCPAIG